MFKRKFPGNALLKRISVTAGVAVVSSILSFDIAYNEGDTISHLGNNNHAKFSTSTYDANLPSEDRLLTLFNEEGWNIGAVFDGHGGWQVSDFAHKNLLSNILPKIKSTRSSDNNSLNVILTEAFLTTEKLYIDKIRPAFELGFGNVASVGSCVLLALQKNNKLIVANCGDCRAVLGSELEGKGDHKALRLTNDHNCRMPLEEYLLRNAHPGETDIIRCKSAHACYVKSRLQLTCALGDIYLKYAEFNAPYQSYRGRHIPEPYTPPYVRTVPDIFHFTLTPQDKFLILATDGLWDFLSDEEAVAIVSRCPDRIAAADALVTAALKKAAEEANYSLEQLQALPKGKQRRNKHDDTTVVVLYFS